MAKKKWSFNAFVAGKNLKGSNKICDIGIEMDMRLAGRYNSANEKNPRAKRTYFELLSTPKFKDTDNATKAYGFITYLGTGTVYDKDNNPVCKIPIDELEFVESDGCVDAVVTGYYYTVETEFGTLWFDYSNDLFYLQFEEGEDNYREYYRLVGKNLDELIAEYGTTTE